MTTALNGTNGSIGTPRVAVDDAGNTYAVWTEGNFIEASKRPVGGAFETPQTIDNGANGRADVPDIGVDGAGNAVIVWRGHAAAGGPTVIKLARRTAGAGSFDTAGASQLSNNVDPSVGPPRIAVNRAGEAIVAFENAFTSSTEISAALGTTTGAFTLREAAPSTTPGDPTVDINEAGDAAVVFTVASTFPEIRALYRVHGQPLPPTASGFELVDNSSVSNKNEPNVAVDSTGRAVAVWSESTNGTITGASRPAGASQTWAAVADLDKPNAGGGSPRVVFETGDGALAAWAGDNVLRSSTRPPGATDFGAAQPLTDATEDPSDLALDSLSGTTALAWAGGGTTLTRAMVRTGGGAFSPIATLTPSGHGGSLPDVAVAPTGNAAAVWIDTSPVDVNPKLATAIYDAVPPSTPSVSVPATGVTGTPVDMTASATDDWSTPVIGWSFGDGAIAFGNTASHTYTAPGTYTVTATALDAVGNTKANTATIVVSDAKGTVDLPTRGVDFN